MKLYCKNPVVLALLCLMAGVFITISFLETPMKFQVSGITLPVALGLGKLMFELSTKIQCVFMALITGGMLLNRKTYTKTDFMVTAILCTILLLEKFWMLPFLNDRVELLSAGKSVPQSEMHSYFIYAESAKAVLLFLSIILQFKKHQNEYRNDRKNVRIPAAG
ncbi:hypothetical protein SAMN04515674_10580 [Pseudarcicella hirudinis]|uniref:DUF4149 domain-containing protein n=1 Tax=Pseudarcicella hirudinis TaxID=1079859 RepID=A0A1I5SKZ6_9BACT|nr:hypothetical protein [Pseudarcicella hirudinis]SFP71430.1 hypothetical protein SAMN04515674_10580 [Pseudarcicella hirudinis]